MIKVQGERLLIDQKKQEETQTATGIILPGTRSEDGVSKEGRIAYIGNESKYEVGQYVWITKFAGEITPEGLMMIDDADVIAVIE